MIDRGNLVKEEIEGINEKGGKGFVRNPEMI